MTKEICSQLREGVSKKITALHKLSRKGKPERELGIKVTEIKKVYMDYAMSLDLSNDSLTDIERELNSSLFFLREDLAWSNKENLSFHKDQLSGIVFEAASVHTIIDLLLIQKKM